MRYGQGDLTMPALYILIIAVTLIWGGLQLYAENICNQSGYPNAKVTWTLSLYCVKRVDQTDTVVPLAEVK